MPSKPQDIWDYHTYQKAFELMIYFPISIVSVYVALYFVLPRYIAREKYVGLLFILAVFTLVYFLLALWLTFLLARLTRHLPWAELPVSFKWFQPIRYGIGLPLTSAALTTTIKLLKNMHLEEKANELLRRRKIDTELQLIKSRFQPDFLLDSLQHIFLLTLNRSDHSPEAVLKLSDLLSYVLYDNQQEDLPLEKEFQVIGSYLALKRLFHPSRLNVHVRASGHWSGYRVAPQALLSVVENCLEEALKSSSGPLTLSLELRAENGEVSLLLKCSGQAGAGMQGQRGDFRCISSRRKLDLLYHGRYQLEVTTENGQLSLSLTLDTRRSPALTTGQLLVTI